MNVVVVKFIEINEHCTTYVSKVSQWDDMMIITRMYIHILLDTILLQQRVTILANSVKAKSC